MQRFGRVSEEQAAYFTVKNALGRIAQRDDNGDRKGGVDMDLNLHELLWESQIAWRYRINQPNSVGRKEEVVSVLLHRFGIYAEDDWLTTSRTDFGCRCLIRRRRFGFQLAKLVTASSRRDLRVLSRRARC